MLEILVVIKGLGYATRKTTCEQVGNNSNKRYTWSLTGTVPLPLIITQIQMRTHATNVTTQCLHPMQLQN